MTSKHEGGCVRNSDQSSPCYPPKPRYFFSDGIVLNTNREYRWWIAQNRVFYVLGENDYYQAKF